MFAIIEKADQTVIYINILIHWEDVLMMLLTMVMLLLMAMMMCERAALVPWQGIPLCNVKLRTKQNCFIFTTFFAHVEMIADKVRQHRGLVVSLLLSLCEQITKG